MNLAETYGKMKHQQSMITPRVILQLLFFIVAIPFLPLLISRQWDWWEAWVYAIISILGFVISRVLATRRNPDLIAERLRTTQHEDTQPWDKQLAPFLGLGGVLVMVVAGLDALLDWSPPYSLPVKIIALIVILLGYVLGSYALIENRFFSGVVRLQTDRGHQVVSSGPYRWIRHPGYAGAFLTYLATPLFLDSSWAFLPTVFVVILFIIRTNLEDRFLQDQLEGYRDYAKRVRYRLLPGVW
jgi:protein-S-isoprenylcysteine O-methyltransferase Ste14